MLTLNTLRAKKGSNSARKRLGRGPASGTGGTAGKGHKGQLARSGGSVHPSFEGGQTPLYRRIPKRGFTSLQDLWYYEAVLNLSDLEKLNPSEFPEISLEGLKKARKIKGRADRLIILGGGNLSKAFVVKAHRLSASAKEKIEKAGGKVELINVGG